MTHHHSFIHETEVQIAERLVREAESDIARQKSIIAELRHDGRAAIGASTLLGLLERRLKGYREARDAFQYKSLSFAAPKGGLTK